METSSYINLIIDEKIALADDLIEKLEENFIEIDGAKKTKRNIEKEKKFLIKLKTKCDENAGLKLKCTNLNFYTHLLFCLQEYQTKLKIISIVKPQESFNDDDDDDDNQDKKILVHIVCDNDNGEQFWIKIIARNNEAITDEISSCEFGHKNILEQADDFLKFANNTRCFRPPKVIFDFLHQMNDDLEITLEEKGVISGRKFRAGTNSNLLDSNKVLNIDITTMIAYVSELSNGGGIDIVFNDKFLDMQREEERVKPVLKVIEKIIEDKKLIACETAVNSFKDIINILGGKKERKRAEDFIARIEVLPDIEDVNQVIKNVELTSHIKERSRKIFAFGIYHSAVTVTSNFGFARAIKMKNLEIPMIFHSARALTEMKEDLIKSIKS